MCLSNILVRPVFRQRVQDLDLAAADASGESQAVPDIIPPVERSSSKGNYPCAYNSRYAMEDGKPQQQSGTSSRIASQTQNGALQQPSLVKMDYKAPAPDGETPLAHNEGSLLVTEAFS